MRPIKLVMQAFGPYADKEVINFDELGNRSMFVISGNTGAGKTTIFDGISFAIYGRASSEDRTGFDLRSQFASDELSTEVSLLFSLRGQTYYINRSPQQQKLKSRGDGFTTINAKAELYKVDEHGDYKLIAANVRETEEKVKEIIQLDAHQFRQILMIPQGEFRKLLTSDSKEKERILQRLFHTELYKQIEQKMVNTANELKWKVEAERNERTRLLKTILADKESELYAEIHSEDLNDLKVMELLKVQLIEMKVQLEQKIQKVNKQKNVRDQAKTSLDRAHDLLQQFQKWEELQKRKSELKSLEPEIKSIEKQIESSQKATKLQNQEKICVRLSRNLKEKRVTLETENSKLAIMQKNYETAQVLLKEEEKKTGLREEIHVEWVQLKEIESHVYSFASRQAEHEKLAIKLKGIHRDLKSLKQQLKEKEVLLNKSESQLKELQGIQLEQMNIEKEALAYERLINQFTDLATILKKQKNTSISISNTEAELSHLHTLLRDKQKTLEAIEKHWLEGQASHLAQNLIPNTSCPVCGSTHHPSPAVNKEMTVTETDLKYAKQDLDHVLSQIALVEKKQTKNQATVTFNQDQIKKIVTEILKVVPNFNLDEMKHYQIEYTNKYSDLKVKLIELEKQLHQIPSTDNLINNLRLDLEKLTEQVEALERKEGESNRQFIESEIELKNIQNTIPKELATRDDYDQKVAKLEGQINELKEAYQIALDNTNKFATELAAIKGRIHSIQASIEELDKELAMERKQFKTLMAAEGFETYQQYEQAIHVQAIIKELEKRVRIYYEEIRSVQDRLQDYHSRLELVEKPNIEKLQSFFNESECLFNQLQQEQEEFAFHFKQNQSIYLKVKEMNTILKEMEHTYQLYGHLADLTKGQNPLRLSFERFVLATFLDQILQMANIRLIKMTNGRYQLVRKTERSKGNVQSGLELLVNDQYTGQHRHVKTLSGGESFKAALALALGLADVVQEHTGGVSLETMFIDEGFGTLDPESLDNAIEALMDIQHNGRLVGIISHVPELRERIDARLEVIAGKEGSYTQFAFLS